MYHLEQNYRSTQTILDAASSLIARNTTHPVLKLWTSQGKGGKVQVFEAMNERDESRFVVATIKEGVNGGGSRQYKDFAILYRTNAQSRPIEEALVREGIPYQLVGGTRFYQRKEIKDLLAYLRLVVNPEDAVSQERALKVGARRLEKFLEWQKNLGESLRKKATVVLLERILEITKYLELYDEEDEEDAMRIENIKELASVAKEFPDLVLFLENVALVENDRLRDARDKAGDDDNRVTLMTMHAAKGLEFPVVFLIGMEEGLFPHSRAMLDKEELEEERRLAYVGMTRVKERLYLTYAQQRLYFGSRNRNLVSRFVGEIPEELIEFAERRFDLLDF
ncbi:MAG: ATP-binding domain-containing protein [Candidatus Chisholmbacteria bacterium]|nr:ATP-binding domain-containing protein [Candidatus Chisholmbacteria bacterium]